MNSSHLSSKTRKLVLGALMGLSTVSCDPASQATLAWISGTGVVVGTITGFGSIYVNGVEYDVERAQFVIDGQTDFATATDAQRNLAVGMVVRLEATDNGDGTGIAARVIYDDAVEGPIESAPQAVNGAPNRITFTVLGRRIVADAVDTVFDGVGFDLLAKDMVVEVSGYIDDSGAILATHVGYKGMFTPGQTRVELHGIVSSLGQSSFMLGGTLVEYGDKTRFYDMKADQLAEGLPVEVAGVYQPGGNILASRIESEEDDRREVVDTDKSVELQGIVYGFVSPSEFRVDDIRVDASGLSSTQTSALSDGVQVEIKGHMKQGVLVAESIKYRGSEAQIKARLSQVNTGDSTVTVDFGSSGPGLVLTVTAETLIKDDRMGKEDASLDLVQLANAVGNGALSSELSIRSQDGGGWSLVSLKLKDDSTEYEVEGVLEGVDTTSVPASLNMFGLVLPLDSTFDLSVFSNGSISVGDRVNVKDTDRNGAFDWIRKETSN